MRSISKAVAAAGLAAATVISGLSFGSAAASAAPASDSSVRVTPQATAPPKGKIKLIFQTGSTYTYSYDARGRVRSTTSLATAKASAAQFDWDGSSLRSSAGCLHPVASSGPNYLAVGTNDLSCHARFADDTFVIDGSRYFGSPISVGGSAYFSEAQFSGLRWVDSSVTNGGFNAAGVGTPASIVPGTTRNVHFGAKVDTAVTAMTGTKVTVTAPGGTTFPAGTTSLSGQYLDSTDNTWRDSTSLTLTGSLSSDRKTFSGTMANTGSGFKLNVGYSARWTAPITAPADASNATSKLDFSATGNTNAGAFTFAGSSPVTISKSAITAVELGPVDLPRGQSTKVPFGVQLATNQNDVDGTVVLTAPEGTTFPAQAKVAGQYKDNGSSTWRDDDKIGLTNGVVSNNGMTLTLKAAWTGQRGGASQQRYFVDVTTPADAAAGDKSMQFTFEGAAKEGPFRAAGATTAVVRQADGGFNATGVGTPQTIKGGTSESVTFGAEVTGRITSMTGTTVTLTAPKDTTFPSNQTTITGEYQKPDTDEWVSTGNLTITGAAASNGKTFTGRIGSTNGYFNLPAGTTTRWKATVSASPVAQDGRDDFGFRLAGTTSLGAFTVTGQSPVTIEATASALSVDVGTVDNVAKQAALSGTATPGADIFVGSTKIATADSSGGWTGKVTGLRDGSNTVTVEQRIGSTKIDEHPVEISIVTVLRDTDGPAKVLDRGTDTTVYAHVGVNTAFTDVRGGKVVFTAPTGTTFASGQQTLIGSYSTGGSWSETARLALEDGQRSADGKTYTYSWNSGSTTTFPNTATIRWGIKVATPATGAAIDEALGYTVAGTADKGTFAAKGSTTTTADARWTNGGFDSEGLGFATTVKGGGSSTAHFGMRATEQVSALNGTRITASAPAGTEFASGQTELVGQRKNSDGTWTTVAALTATGTVSGDGRTFSGRVANTTSDLAKNTEIRWVISLTAPATAEDGSGDLGFTVDGTTNAGPFTVNGKSPVTIEATTVALTAKAGVVDHLEKTAALSGTATKGAAIWVGTTKIATVDAAGNWKGSVDGLKVGSQDITVVQKVDGVEIDEKTVTVVVVEGGTIVPGTTAPVVLERGDVTDVPFTVKNEQNRTNMVGTVELTAPEGTEFAGQMTAEAQYRVGESGSWKRYAPLDLDNGTMDETRKSIVFSLDTEGGNMKSDEQYRYVLKVKTPADAATGESKMGYVYKGTSSQGSYNATGSTTTKVAESKDPADLVVTAPENGKIVDTKRPTFSGTGEPGAAITVAGTTRPIATATVQPNGEWTTDADFDLADGFYALTVTQVADGTTQTKPVTFRIKDRSDYVALTATGGFDPEDSTKPATIRGNATSGATVIIKDSLGNEVNRGTAANETYSIPVPPAKAHTGQNDFTVTQTVKNEVSPSVPVSLDYGTPAPVVVTSPKNGDTVDKQGLTFSGTGEDKAKVIVKGMVNTIASGTVSGNAWTAPVDFPLSNNVYKLWAVQTTKGGLTTQQQITITITSETIAPLTATAEFDPRNENAPAKISGTAHMDGTVIITTSDGTEVGRKVALGGNYSVQIDPKYAHFGVNEFTIVQVVGDKQSAPLVRSLDYGTPAAPIIASPINGATMYNGSLMFTGTGQAGADLTIRGMTNSLVTGKVEADGWNVTVDRKLKPNFYRLFAVQTSKGGLTKQAEVGVTIRDKSVTQLTAVGNFDEQDPTKLATISGKAQTGGKVVVQENGKPIKTETVTNGSYSIDIPATVAGKRTLSITQTVDEVTSPAVPVELDYGTVTPLEITTPTEGERVGSGKLVFTGTATAGASVKVGGTTTVLGTAKANGSGEWTIPVTRTLPPQVYVLYVKQTTKGGLEHPAEVRTITITR